MPTLIIRSSDGTEQRFDVQGELSVGREAGNDVVLRDQGVSRRHCRFFLAEDGQVWVEDLGSSNGVVIDGQPISGPTSLAEGVEALIGPACAMLEPSRRAAAPKRPRPGPAASTSRPGSEALAKREPNAGAVKPRATRMMAASEMPARQPRPAAGKLTTDGRPRLRGMSGPWAGQVFELSKPRMMVGRLAPADIVVDDDSVSRRHAELFKTGSLLSVRDLGSANGTFLNGERVSEAPLSPGDVLRFGVVEFSFAGPGEARAGAAGKGKGTGADAGKRKKLMMLGGIGAVVLLGLVGLVVAGGGQPVEGGGGGGIEPPPDPAVDPLKMLSQCKAYSDRDSESLNWEKALDVCGKVLEADPTLIEARQLERLAKKEIDNQKLLDDAKLKVATSQDDQALALLVQVDRASTSFMRARSMFREAADRIEKRSKTRCKTEFKAGYYQQAAEACGRFLEVTCNKSEGVDAEIKSNFERAARQSGRKAEFTCPPEYLPFQGGVNIVDATMGGDSAVRHKYGDPQIAQVMVRYLNNGRPKQAADELKRMRVKEKAKYRDSLDDLIAQLEVIDGRYVSGQEGILRNNPGETESYWKEAFEADARLMPANVRSYMAKDMGAQLAKAYFKVGMDLLQKGNLREGFKAFHKGYQYDRSNQDVLLQLAGMERAASRALTEGGCENVAYALDITIPDGDTNKRALRMKQEMGCP